MADKIIIMENSDMGMIKEAVARLLEKKGWGQREISDILGITQPMVSRYLSSKNKLTAEAKKTAEEIARKENIRFAGCVYFSEKKLDGEYYIGTKEEIMSEEKDRIIDNINKAFFILRGKDIGKILPKVKVNIVMCDKSVKGAEDVASLSNGFVIINDKISSMSGIRFGKSEHLANLILYLKKEGFEANSIMNIKLNESMFSGLKTGILTKDYRLSEKKESDILLHKGDFGIEPCAYVLGKDAVDVANKIIKIVGDKK